MALDRISLLLVTVLLAAAHGAELIPNAGTHHIDADGKINIDLGDLAPGSHHLDLTTSGDANLDFWVYVGKELVDSSESLLNRLSTEIERTGDEKVVVIVRNRSKERDAVKIKIIPAAAAAKAPRLAAA